MFRALADPTRRQILYELREHEVAAGEIASHFPISGPSVSRHLAVLKSAGLVAERRQANKVLYSLVSEQLATAVGPFLSAVCPDGVPLARRSKKKSKSTSKASAKRKHKALVSPAIASREPNQLVGTDRAGTDPDGHPEHSPEPGGTNGLTAARPAGNWADDLSEL